MTVFNMKAGLLALAEDALRRRQFPLAISVVDHLLKLPSVDRQTRIQALCVAADAYLAVGRVHRAEQRVVDAMLLDAADARVFHLDGRIALALDAGERALRSLKRARSLDKKDRRIASSYGVAQVRFGDQKRGMKLLEKIRADQSKPRDPQLEEDRRTALAELETTSDAELVLNRLAFEASFRRTSKSEKKKSRQTEQLGSIKVDESRVHESVDQPKPKIYSLDEYRINQVSRYVNDDRRRLDRRVKAADTASAVVYRFRRPGDEVVEKEA